MPLQEFKIFSAIAKHCNLTQASKELHLSQPAITQQLKNLEVNYNVKLYTKGGSGIKLTDAGNVFLTNVKFVLKLDERLRERLSMIVAPISIRPLTVGGSHSPSVSLLPTLLARFTKEHPHIPLNLRTSGSADIERQVETGEVDIGVVSSPPKSRSLHGEPYCEQSLVAFVSREHGLARKRKLTLEDFARIPLVIREGKGGRGTTEKILGELKKKGFDFTVAMRCESPDAVKVAVKQNIGIGILFESTVLSDITTGEFRRIKLADLNLVRRTFIIYHQRRPLTPLARQFLELLRNHKDETGNIKANTRSQLQVGLDL